MHRALAPQLTSVLTVLGLFVRHLAQPYLTAALQDHRPDRGALAPDASLSALQLL
jgi:hypothetical protein